MALPAVLSLERQWQRMRPWCTATSSTGSSTSFPSARSRRATWPPAPRGPSATWRRDLPRRTRSSSGPIAPAGCSARPWSPTSSTRSMDGERLVIHASTQVPWHLRRIVARVLGIRENRIRVIKERMGGGYGSKQDILLEERLRVGRPGATGRPVFCKYTREEEFIAATTRHPFRDHGEDGGEEGRHDHRHPHGRRTPTRGPTATTPSPCP